VYYGSDIRVMVKCGYVARMRMRPMSLKVLLFAIIRQSQIFSAVVYKEPFKMPLRTFHARDS